MNYEIKFLSRLLFFILIATIGTLTLSETKSFAQGEGSGAEFPEASKPISNPTPKKRTTTTGPSADVPSSLPVSGGRADRQVAPRAASRRSADDSSENSVDVSGDTSGDVSGGTSGRRSASAKVGTSIANFFQVPVGVLDTQRPSSMNPDSKDNSLRSGITICNAPKGYTCQKCRFFYDGNVKNKQMLFNYQQNGLKEPFANFYGSGRTCKIVDERGREVKVSKNPSCDTEIESWLRSNPYDKNCPAAKAEPEAKPQPVAPPVAEARKLYRWKMDGGDRQDCNALASPGGAYIESLEDKILEIQTNENRNDGGRRPVTGPRCSEYLKNRMLLGELCNAVKQGVPSENIVAEEQDPTRTRNMNGNRATISGSELARCDAVFAFEKNKASLDACNKAKDRIINGQESSNGKYYLQALFRQGVTCTQGEWKSECPKGKFCNSEPSGANNPAPAVK